MPTAIAVLSHIDRFGVQGVFGRPLSVSEIAQMRTAENIVAFTRAREKSGDFAEWTKNNPQAQKLVAEARRCAKEEGLLSE